ncbi:hypothetical protein [Candidatus Finniella inopinata]|uniref:Lytic transglycosylase MltA domain-containing protein n=1 Tax=Candidatus Finniella inopinata TaxID=1696036 RepID=A0A4Q7DIK1_9PROT|nr:hypothetical protein [Candidatus Finniella inopinata]RZI45804.1 hypothetical protein EQU50_05050 [Candidatus Finniella inopinata]
MKTFKILAMGLFFGLPQIYEAAASCAAEPSATQEDYNRYCAGVLSRTYRAMNENNNFSVKPSTQSAYWETKTLLGNPFIVKKRGIPLSAALADLTKKESKTEFECMTAQQIGFWNVLSSATLDNSITELERDESFFLPLISSPGLSPFEAYASARGFWFREGTFNVGPHPVDMQEEWSKIQAFKSNLTKLELLLDCVDPVQQDENSLPYQTVLGGTIYLPNVEGITGPARGENLVCVDDKAGLHYGYGPFFKDGPKTLSAIGKELETYARTQDSTGYFKKMIAPLQTLKAEGKIQKMKDGTHPLQYHIIREACCYFKMPEGWKAPS